MPKFIPVKKYVGVAYYESLERKHLGKPDRCFYAVYKDHGRKVREKVGWLSEGVNAALAANIRSERLRTLRLGQTLEKKDPTLSEVWREYETWAKTTLKRPDNVTNLYRWFLEKPLANRRLSDITPLHVEKIRIRMSNDGLSKQTVRHALGLLRAIINKAIVWGLWAGENPVNKVGLPSAANRRERFLSPEEATALLKALHARSREVYGLALVSLHTGMRLGELLALKWEHVDFGRGTIAIIEGEQGTTKNEESRVATMTREVQGYLEERCQPAGLVFPGRDGKPAADLSKTFSRVVAAMGFNNGVVDRRQRVSFHTLRHTFASWLAIGNVPIRTIMDLMGHKTMAMTAWYAKLSPAHKQEAIKVLPHLDPQSEQPSSPATPPTHGEDKE